MRERHEILLSGEQREARDAEDRYLLVLASAGSGKTEVVAQRVERILADGAGFRVLALSYTRRAAAELRDRFAARLGDASRRVEADTIHGFAHGLLIQYGTWLGLPADPTLIVDDTDRVELMQAWRTEAGLPPLSNAREQLLRLDAARARGLDDPLTEAWDAALANSGALDYESMLSRAAELLQIPAVGGAVARLYRHVVVDEAQNLTASQYGLLRGLLYLGAEKTQAMFVGDDKQSIVGFAGADPEHMHEFARQFSARTIRLTENFRSATQIAGIGREVARALGDPHPPEQTYAASGQVTRVELDDEQAEAQWVLKWVEKLLTDGLPEQALAPGEDRSVRDREVAVLGRTSASLRACGLAFAEAGIPVSRATHADDWLGSEFAKAAWLLATYRPDSDVSARRLRRRLGVDPESWTSVSQSLQGEDADLLRRFAQQMTPKDFVDRVSNTQIEDADWAKDQDEIDMVWRSFCDRIPVADRDWSRFVLYVARWQRGDELETGVRLHTVHKAQGREYRGVAVVGLNDGQFPDFRAKSSAEREAELRAFYVAVTRPSRMLLLSRPRSVRTRNGMWQREPSPFLEYVPVLLSGG